MIFILRLENCSFVLSVSIFVCVSTEFLIALFLAILQSLKSISYDSWTR